MSFTFSSLNGLHKINAHSIRTNSLESDNFNIVTLKTDTLDNLNNSFIDLKSDLIADIDDTYALGSTTKNMSNVYSTIFSIGSNAVLSGTTLGSTIVSSSLTSVGVISSGTWEGDALSAANMVALSAIDIDGGTDIGAPLTDADLFIVDDGAGGTNRKSIMSRIPTFLNNHSNLTALNNLVTVGTLDSGSISSNFGSIDIGTSNFTGRGLTLNEGDITQFDPNNSASPFYRIGSDLSNHLQIQTMYDTGAQTIDYVLFRSITTSATADKGLFRFEVDDTDVLDIQDDGLNLNTGKVFKINDTSVLSGTTLGSGIVNSSLTGLGTISSGTWQATAIADSYISSAATWNATGISNTNYVLIDSAGVVDNDYAKFTANGLEGRSFTEVKTDLSLDNVENTAISTWAGSSNITTLGTISSGLTVGVGDFAVSNGDGYITGTGDTRLTINNTDANSAVIQLTSQAYHSYIYTNSGGGLFIDGINCYIISDLFPGGDSAYDLGSSSLRWANIYLDDLDLDSGTTGSIATFINSNAGDGEEQWIVVGKEDGSNATYYGYHHDTTASDRYGEIGIRATVSCIRWYPDGDVIMPSGGLTVSSSHSGYGGGEVMLGSTSASLQSAISTQSSGAPTMFFDHRGSSNTGGWSFRNGSGAASTQLEISATGAITAYNNIVLEGGLHTKGSRLGASGADHQFGGNDDNEANTLYTLSTSSPTMSFAHRATSNTGSFLWANGSSGGTNLLTLSSDGTLTVRNDLLPGTDSSYDLGSTSNLFANCYTDAIYLNNDAVWGDHNIAYVLAAKNYTRIGATSGSATGNGYIYVYRDGNLETRNIFPNDDNSFDIGTSSLRYDDIYATNTTIQSSSRDLKENISTSDLGLEFINKLKPVSYNWKTKTRMHYGFIAEDIGEILQERKNECAFYIDSEFKEKPKYLKAVEEFEHKIVSDKKGVDDHNEKLKQDYETAMQEYINKEDKSLLTKPIQPKYKKFVPFDRPQESKYHKGLRMVELLCPLTKAIQELSEIVTKQQQQIDSLLNLTALYRT